MRTLGNYFFELILFKRRHILFGQGLEQVFISRSPCRITTTSFFIAQDSVVHCGSIQNLYHCLTDFLAQSIVGTSTADPVEYVGCLFITHHRHIQPFGPLSAIFRRNTPGITVVLHILEGGH